MIGAMKRRAGFQRPQSEKQPQHQAWYHSFVLWKAETDRTDKRTVSEYEEAMCVDLFTKVCALRVANTHAVGSPLDPPHLH